MEAEFLTFRKFTDMAFAGGLTDMLDDNHIAYQVEQNSLINNPLLIAGNEMTTEYVIKLRPRDFNKVNALLEVYEEQAVDEVGKDHYLFDFTNDELIDLLKNYNEWSAFDFVLARKILNDRGVTIPDKEIEEYKEEAIEVLSTPEESQAIWVIMGYVLAFLGGLVGLFIGWMMWKFKKTLPNGERVYAYTDANRVHGTIIFFIGLVVFIVVLVTQIYDFSIFTT